MAEEATLTEKLNVVIKENSALTHTVWKQPQLYTCGNISIITYSAATGCGLRQINGIRYIGTSKYFEAYKAIIEAIKENEKLMSRAFIATLGHRLYQEENAEKNLYKLGFTLVAEYYNAHHNNGDLQRLYLLNFSETEN